MFISLTSFSITITSPLFNLTVEDASFDKGRLYIIHYTLSFIIVASFPSRIPNSEKKKLFFNIIVLNNDL